MLDLIDRGILSDLAYNCRTSYEELSRKYGLSANAIKRRVQKLEDTRVIDGYAVTLTPEMHNVDFAFGLVWTDGSQDEISFIESIGNHECVIAAASYTNGIYALVNEYDSPERLMQFGTFLRQLESVSNVELFPYVDKLESNTITARRGDLIELTNLHLRILRYLEEDPRMSVIDLAKISGLTAKRTRKLVRELLESNNVYFSAQVELGNAGSIPFLMRISIDESKKTQLEMSHWLWEEFPLEMWENFPCVFEPLIFSLLCVNEMNQVDQITRNVRGQGFVNSVLVMMATHHGYFPGLRARKLKQLIKSV